MATACLVFMWQVRPNMAGAPPLPTAPLPPRRARCARGGDDKGSASGALGGICGDAGAGTLAAILSPWMRVVDTSQPSPEDCPDEPVALPEVTMSLASRSFVLLLAREETTGLQL